MVAGNSRVEVAQLTLQLMGCFYPYHWGGGGGECVHLFGSEKVFALQNIAKFWKLQRCLGAWSPRHPWKFLFSAVKKVDTITPSPPPTRNIYWLELFFVHLSPQSYTFVRERFFLFRYWICWPCIICFSGYIVTLMLHVWIMIIYNGIWT